MIWIAITIVTLFAAAWVVQRSIHQKYINWLATSKLSDELAMPAPRVVIILCLRGADEDLNRCLDRLAALDYPDYAIHAVIDHPSDSSNEVVSQWKSLHPTVDLVVHFLHDISPYCYLKTSAIRQCLKSVGHHFDIAVMVDADTLVYPRWLRDLVSPFSDSSVGLVTGNRWYDPCAKGLGTRVRFIYNAWTIAPMYLMNATWGGSLAMRREVYSTEFFFEKMLDTSSEESAMQAATRHVGKKLVVHPNVIICDRSTVGLISCFKFIRRQLLWTRLYHPHWQTILLAATTIYLGQLLAIALAVVMLVQGEFWLFLSIVLSMVGLFVGNVAEFSRLSRSISARNQSHQETQFHQPTTADWFKIFASLPIAFVAFVYAVFAASFAKRVTWRGVQYQVLPPNRLKLVEYQPYCKDR